MTKPAPFPSRLSLSFLATLSNAGFFLLLTLLAFLFHYRSGLFYHWDEWNALDRFVAQGFDAAFLSHNEHFLPLFFITYFSQISIVGLNYWALIVVSLLLHSFNALLLSIFLTRLADAVESFKTSHTQIAARLIAALYLISALHSETLQWAFEQSLVLRQIASIVSLLAALSYLKHGKASALAISLVMTLLAPFLFGSGLLLPVEMLLLVAFLYIASTSLDISFYSRSRKLLFSSFALLIPVLLIYYLNRKGAGHTVDDMKLQGGLLQIFSYIFCASQFGTVLRGVGFYPSLELDAASNFLPLFIRARISAEIFFSLSGTAISIALLLLYRRSEHRRRNVSLWLFGQCWILLSFILPALGRWQYGLIQSLSLRYQYTALVGLALVAMPLVLEFLEHIWQNPKRKQWQRFGFIYLAYHCGLAAILAYHFIYYTEKGSQNKQYIHQLLNSAPNSDPTLIHFPESLAPGIHPLRIREIAHAIEN